MNKLYRKLGSKSYPHALIPSLFKKYNKENGSAFSIQEFSFPAAEPYGWHNYPFDYYNLWVKNAGPGPYMNEPTLEMLTKDYQVIVLKHCFPVSNLQPDSDTADIDSDYKSLANYKLQYIALREKLHQFPDSKFIVWTGAALVESQTNEEEAVRAGAFFEWVKTSWDIDGDNIFIWDFHSLQTEGGLYFKNEFAASVDNSHPGKEFADKAGRLFFNRIIDVIVSGGMKTDLTGRSLSENI